jgi:hypothetical protein
VLSVWCVLILFFFARRALRSVWRNARAVLVFPVQEADYPALHKVTQ